MNFKEILAELPGILGSQNYLQNVGDVIKGPWGSATGPPLRNEGVAMPMGGRGRGGDTAQTSFGAPDIGLRNTLEIGRFGRPLTDFERSQMSKPAVDAEGNMRKTIPGTDYYQIEKQPNPFQGLYDFAKNPPKNDRPLTSAEKYAEAKNRQDIENWMQSNPDTMNLLKAYAPRTEAEKYQDALNKQQGVMDLGNGLGLRPLAGKYVPEPPKQGFERYVELWNKNANSRLSDREMSEFGRLFQKYYNHPDHP